MQLSVGIKSAIASARLWALMLRIRDPSKLYKFWGIRVMNQARANARAKGGRRLWKQIADAVVLQGVSLRGADIRGVGLFGRIGMHKEKGGPIRVREKNWLTIPIDPAAYGKTAAEYSMETGVRLFRPGRKDNPKKILAYAQDGTLVPVFALCKMTAPQRADPWLPDRNWVLHAGIEEAKRLIAEKK